MIGTTQGEQPITLMRYSEIGSALDTNFNTTGIVKPFADHPTATDPIVRVKQSDPSNHSAEQIIVAARDQNTKAWLLARYKDNGDLDTSFGTNGKLVIPMNTNNSPKDIKFDGDGNIYLLSYYPSTVTKVLTNGTLDNTFGTNGVANLGIDGQGAYLEGVYAESLGMTITRDGKIMVFGGHANTADWEAQFMVARLNANGSVDTDFGKTVYTLGDAPVLLTNKVVLFDGELSSYQNMPDQFNGATLTLARQTAADSDDVFSAASGSKLTLANGTVTYDSVTVGTFTQTNGTLSITFNSSASAIIVQGVAQSIAYNYKGTLNDSTDINLVWTLNDGNTGTQGTGGAKQAAGVQIVKIAISVAVVPHVLDLDQVGDGHEANTNSTAQFDWGVPAYLADSATVLGNDAPAEYKNLTISFDMSSWTARSYPVLAVADSIVTDSDDSSNEIALTSNAGSSVFEKTTYGGSTGLKLSLTGSNGDARVLTIEKDGGRQHSKS